MTSPSFSNQDGEKKSFNDNQKPRSLFSLPSLRCEQLPSTCYLQVIYFFHNKTVMLCMLQKISTQTKPSQQHAISHSAGTTLPHHTLIATPSDDRVILSMPT
jgi:hypothetical protein